MFKWRLHEKSTDTSSFFFFLGERCMQDVTRDLLLIAANLVSSWQLLSSASLYFFSCVFSEMPS